MRKSPGLQCMSHWTPWDRTCSANVGFLWACLIGCQQKKTGIYNIGLILFHVYIATYIYVYIYILQHMYSVCYNICMLQHMYVLSFLFTLLPAFFSEKLWNTFLPIFEQTLGGRSPLRLPPISLFNFRKMFQGWSQTLWNINCNDLLEAKWLRLA